MITLYFNFFFFFFKSFRYILSYHFLIVILLIDFGCRMELKNAGNCVVAMVTYVAVGCPSYLQFTSLPVHMKETTLFCFYRYFKMKYLFLIFFFLLFHIKCKYIVELWAIQYALSVCFFSEEDLPLDIWIVGNTIKMRLTKYIIS